MSAKPTPGPWHSDGIYIWSGKDGTASLKMVADLPFEDDAAHLARVRGVGRGATPEEQEANARLIAAAPELLEALREALSYIRSCADAEVAPRADGHGYQDAAAVLAKAEGR